MSAPGFSLDKGVAWQSGAVLEVISFVGLVIWRRRSLSLACVTYGNKMDITSAARASVDRDIEVSFLLNQDL
jgi:hypothetical protein